jgi:ATP-dependent DNA helicase DinG
MNRQPETAATQTVTLPDIPAVYVSGSQVAILTTDGEIQILSHDQARLLLHKKEIIVCHAPFTRSRLKLDEFRAFDVLELFAFTHPAMFSSPTVQGLCLALGITAPKTLEDYPLSLVEIATALLSDLRTDMHAAKADPLKIAAVMGMNGKGWPWSHYIFSARGQPYDQSEIVSGRTALNIWKNLPEWAEEAPEPPASHHGVTGDESRDRLAKLLLSGPHISEPRPQQIAYTTQLTAAFAPAENVENPHVVLAEAGTGTGKTLGYLAPASVWAEKNAGAVWISTYTKNLQRQIDQELNRLYPSPELKELQTSIRKGRENYLCLLNFEENAAAAEIARHPNQAIAAGIMARWAAATRDGDLSGSDFPGWLPGLLGFQETAGLADRRGECIFSACDHYHRCFVERSIRKAKRARIVVANHALVMIQSALSNPGEEMPSRYVFDEGHHLFDAADSAYAAHLSALETRDFRRWILGAEGGRRSRARGLKRRVEDLIAGDHALEMLLDDIIMQARVLTADSWTKRLKDSAPQGACEQFLAAVYQQVNARADGRDGPYSLETETHPLIPDVLAKAKVLKSALNDLKKPMVGLSTGLRKKLTEDEGLMDPDIRKRLDSVSAALDRRTQMTLQAWINMLETLESGTKNPDFIDWMEIERIDGKAHDIGLYRHCLDPMKAFAASIKPHVHGMVVTSATLRDHSDANAQDNDGWDTALKRTGASYLSTQPQHYSYASPFDYAAQTKVFIINDVRKDDLAQVAGAYRSLFEASRGGALGLFTAIQRLRAVHEKISQKLERQNIPLYAQHVDEIDPGTLVDMFREDLNACLLGTDAIRDGVDVPGESLRLIVFDRVPWPRPTILHKARRDAFGKKAYDEMITRLKIKQAFGRLIRRADDRGVFVMMDPMFPSRLHNAFPPETPILKCGLAEASQAIRAFLQSPETLPDR